LRFNIVTAVFTLLAFGISGTRLTLLFKIEFGRPDGDG
jgi:hypothetical protein